MKGNNDSTLLVTDDLATIWHNEVFKNTSADCLSLSFLRHWVWVNTTAVFLYGHKYLKQRRHAVVKSAAGPASSPLLRRRRGESAGVGGAHCAPEGGK